MLAGLASGQTTGLIYSAVSGGLAVTGYGAGSYQEPITVLPANIIIPDTYQGTNVVAIANEAFYSNGSTYDGTALTNVVCGTNVVTIGDYAFRLTSLTTINCPNVVTIGDSAFANTPLTTFSGPNVVTIGDSAFNSTALTTFSGQNVVTIGDYAFYVTALTNAVFGASLDTIEGSAFDSCASLTSVRFEGNKPSTVGEDIYGASPDVTNYVHITSTGWDRTFGDRPVVGIEGAYPFPVIPIDTLVFASKLLTPSNMIVVPSASMSTSLWDSSVLWLTAESPILNSGTTNAAWVCYAKSCLGNPYQKTIASQPTTITTNGYKAMSFDGGDCLIYEPSSLPQIQTVSFWVKHSTWNAQQIIFNSNSDKFNTSIGINTSDALLGSDALSFKNSGATVGCKTTNLTDGAWVHMAFVREIGGNRIYLNGASQTVAGATGWAFADGTVIGGRNATTPTLLFNGQIASFSLHTNALTGDQVSNLYNTTKSKYQ